MNQSITVSAFYKFTPLPHYLEMREPVKRAMLRRGIKGTITLAPEGINATVSGEHDALFDLLDELQRKPEIGTFIHKESYVINQPFQRTKVKVKKELISLGKPVDPTVCVGTYLDAEDWNALISQPDVVTIDTRNDYEFRIGHFKGAVNPGTRDFKEMVAFTKTHLDPKQHKRVAMYCTGGIRCEKYSSYLMQEGFAEVYHLRGGILQYLEDMPQERSLWEGKCFVFDERVAVNHDLSKAEDIIMCMGCGGPLMTHDLEHKSYVENISCGYCKAL